MRSKFSWADPAAPVGRAVDWGALLSSAVRACCCSAKPTVTVVLPMTDRNGRPIELLLCGHHHRISHDALTSAGAVVFDGTGALVTTWTWSAA
jgi:hypothetical protein